jgi:hypothetical protein
MGRRGKDEINKMKKDIMKGNGVKVEETKKINMRTTRFEDRYNNHYPATAPEMLVGISYVTSNDALLA